MTDKRDPLRREHEDGDADGLGCFRGGANLLALLFLIGLVIWLLTAMQAKSIFG